MFLLGATHNVWCSIASAAVVGATVVGATAVNSVVIGADWCSSGFGVVSSVLYDAIVVQQWLAQQGVCAASVGAATMPEWALLVRWITVEWCVEPCAAQRRCVELSCRATHSQMHAE